MSSSMGLLDRAREQREIQEAKINLVKLLSECRNEDDLYEVMKLKQEFMKRYSNQNHLKHRVASSEWDLGSNMNLDKICPDIDDAIIQI